MWDKARLNLELAESKLKKLYSELKIQDKEELTLKRLKAEGGDKVRRDLRQNHTGKYGFQFEVGFFFKR